MNIVVGVVIAIVLIAIAFQALATVFGAIVKIASSFGSDMVAIIKSFENGFVDWLGRKRLGRKARIPADLSEGHNPLPNVDTEKSELAQYKPRVTLYRTMPPIVFKGTFDAVFTTLLEPQLQIDVDRLPEILSMSSHLPYEALLNRLGENCAYPNHPPSQPDQIQPPPIWTRWRPEFDEPTFEPPYYGSRLAILNRFVDAAHRPEAERAVRAAQRRDQLLDKCKKRNAEMHVLAANAKSIYDQAVATQDEAYRAAKTEYERYKQSFEHDCTVEQNKLSECADKMAQSDGSGHLARVELMLRTVRWPRFVSHEGQTRFDVESGILIHEHRFPDLSSIQWVKRVVLKQGASFKPANQREKKEAAAKLYPSLCLRLAAELVRIDSEGMLKAVAVNGWADYAEKATGQWKRAYCASLFATTEQISRLALTALEPKEAFAALKGLAARSLELTPIAPVIRLDTNDPRFVDAKDILSKLAEGENLASMHWEDFEHLCRELFERAFAGSGAEVKVTQASRDQGVDAVIFDPDPLRGGKIVIQAKRYTNTVEVSAVRDLYGAVINEGAIKGILVTTSQYGPDAYSFSKDKPITLIDGRELLGLLEKYGYKFRINLAEAKALL